MTTHHADVIVIGGGVAGLTAAVRSSQLGLSTLVLEKLSEDRYVCNSRLTGGVFHLALNDINQAPEVLVDAIMKSTGGAADAALARLMARNAKPVVSWLQSLGIRFIRGADPWHSFVLAPPGIAALGRQWEGRAGDVLLRTLESKLTAAQGKILRGHAAFELIMEDSRCTGVRAHSGDGLVECFGKAVVLADGGFQASLDLLEKHISPNPSQVVQRNARTGMGDALRMATQVGAASSALGGFYGHVLSRDALTNDVLWPYPWLDELLKYYLMVDKQGKRFADEGCGGVYVANQIAALPDPAGTFVVCDEEGWQTAGKERFLPPNPNLTKAGATVICANSITELAQQTEIDPAGLEASIAAYNRALNSGKLHELTPPRTTEKAPARPITKPPFYAIPAAAGITYTMGGVRIDDGGRVQNTGGSPIAGLYAAGSSTGGVEGGPRVGYVGGLVKASTTGYICAETIHSEVML